jgi:hypothetical protein
MVATTNGALATAITIGLAMSASPFGVVSVIVLLGTRRPLADAWSFVAGWMFSVALFGLLTATVMGNNESGSSTSTATGLMVGAGVVLLIVGIVLWLRRSSGGPATRPKWMDRAERISPVFAFGLGLVLPTWSMIVPVVNSITDAGLTRGVQIAIYIVFVIAAAALLLLPVIVYTVRREWASSMLAAWQGWVLDNAKAVVAVILVVLGVMFIARGLLSA